MFVRQMFHAVDQFVLTKLKIDIDKPRPWVLKSLP